jgi:Pirin C-terminal cupin domain
VSNLDPAPEAIALMPGVAPAGESGVRPGVHRAVDVLEARKAAVGDGTEVRRLLPQRTLRTVGPAVVTGALIAPGLLAHLPVGLSEIRISPAGGPGRARFFVLGGAPFAERLLMWWNFVGRSSEEIAQARDDWEAGRFGEVHGYPGEPLAAPPLPAVSLKPR